MLRELSPEEQAIYDEYKDKKLSKLELEPLSIFMRLALCKCDFCIPGPVWIDAECPIHWDLADGKVCNT